MYSTGLDFGSGEIAKFISSKIVQRECKQYARNGKSTSNVCKCGREVQWHTDKSLECNPDTDHDDWKPKTHTKTMNCDSFGEIFFRGVGHGTRNSPYVRLASDTDLDDVWKILTNSWHLPIPKLLISVTGGAKYFEMKPRLKDMLKQGLCHAATSTGAWIITGGTGTGIMQIVGEAIHEYTMAHDVQDQKLVALGIATWGIISNRSALVGKGDKGLFPATYAIKDVQADTREAPLDHNHTHFILVDNGTENIYGGEIEFRTALESYISTGVTGVAQNQSKSD
ncbi:transient receptor potential cation channel subfamily M member 8-like [Gigantopelta aegis]|uniref:transient receptor potential cation channel subfamily M member 8-like n=1 Tax=Gigantopelta aegis TaxID=1735272 RepID=UPI001B88CA2D|nr:transient receptor potential cation channel subfamily M member 8-like [Gigantopelta aegis]